MKVCRQQWVQCGHAVVGRVCNRIAGAEFELDGNRYPLYQNDGVNHLHGGKRGFDKYVWAVEELPDGLRLTRTSPDGEEGYPGTMRASVTYRVDGVSLRLDYEAPALVCCWEMGTSTS